MGAYRADIEIGVKGVRRLEQARSAINLTARAVDSLNDAVGRRGGLVQSIQNYVNNLDRAAASLKNVGAGTQAEAKAVREYVQALGEANQARARQNSLIAQQLANQRRVRPGDAGFGQQTPALPPGMVRSAQIKQNWSRFFRDAADVAADLQQTTAAKRVNIQNSWKTFFEDAATTAAQLKQNSAAQRVNIQNNWRTFFADAAEIAADLKSNSAAQRLAIQNSWSRFFQDAADLATDLTAQIRSVEAARSSAARANLARQAAGRNRVRDAGFGIQGPALPPSAGGGGGNGGRTGGQSSLANVALGAGFPLLFGGGPGAVLGGAAGGLVPGQGAFAAQIALSALGQQLDTFIGRIATLGQALNPLTADLDAVITSSGLAGTALGEYIKDLEDADKATEALRVATAELTFVIGYEGVQAIQDFGEQTQELTNQWDVLITQVSAGLAGLLQGPVAALLRAVEAQTALNIARTSDDPQLKTLQGQLSQQGPAVALPFGGPTLNAQDRLDIESQIVERVRELRKEREGIINPVETVLKANQTDLNVLQAQLGLAQTNGDITQDNVYQLERKLIIQKTYAKLQEAINKKQETESILLAEQVELAQLDRRRKQAQDRTAAQEARQGGRTADQAVREAERVNKVLINQRAVTLEIQRQSQFSAKIAAAELAKDPVLVRRLQGEQALSQLGVQTAKQLELEKNSAAQLAIAKSAQAKADLIRQETAQDIARIEQDRKEKFDDILASLTYEIEYEAAITREKREQLELEEAIRKAKGQGLTPDQVDQIAEQTKRRQAQQRPLQKYMTDLEKSLNDTEGKAVQLAQTIESELSTAMSSAITGIITGTTTVEEAFSQMFLNIGKAFMDMATQMLAQQLILSILKGVIGGGANMGGDGYFDPMTGKGVAGPNFGFAKGGYPPVGQASLVGENGPELFVPGRQGAIVPNDIFAATRAALNKGGTSGAGAFEENAQALAVSSSYTRERVTEKERQTMLTGAGGSMLIQTEVINNVEYATVDQVAQAAAASAKQARAQVFADMRNKPSTRASLGMR